MKVLSRSLARAPEQGHVYVGSTWPASRPGPVLASLIISSCSSSAPTELSSSAATESHSAEKDEGAIAQCLVASRGWGAQIVAFLSFLSTHSDANTKFKFNFFSSIEIEIRNFDIKSMTLDSSNQP